MSTATYIAHNDESTIDCHLERKSLSDLIVRQIAHADLPKQWRSTALGVQVKPV
ncbi:MAG: hypothetical protein R2825_27495 [Saprospiraceae bacterium]